MESERINMTITEAPQAQKLRINDSRLPLLVSQAAMELDHAARGESKSLSHAQDFFLFLRESLEADAGETEHRWLDPETVDVFEHALRNSGVHELRTVQDVIRESLQFVNGIGEKAKRGLEPDMEALLRFCVAFGNSLLAHRAQYRPEFPANPFRR
jgi:hypothetical protein